MSLRKVIIGTLCYGKVSFRTSFWMCIQLILMIFQCNFLSCKHGHFFCGYIDIMKIKERVIQYG